jgi:hypothetical protein
MTEHDHTNRMKLHTRGTVRPITRTKAHELDGADEDSLLKKAKSRAQDPDIFEEFPPYFYFVESSNNTLDWYGTRMDESSLKNYAKNLQDGRSFLNDHNMTQRIGQSLDGWYVEEDDTHDDGIPVRRTIGAFFTLPGQRWANMATDDFIAGVRSGVFRDVSIGFWADDMRCSVCDGQMYSGWFGTFGIECDHIPGMEYAVDANGKEIEAGSDATPDHMQLCYVWVHDAEMAETSNVYDGATPDASFVKAKAMAEAGKLDARMIGRFEQRYNTKLPRRSVESLPVTAGGSIVVPTTPLYVPSVTTTASTSPLIDTRATVPAQEDPMAKAAETTVTLNWEQLKPGLTDLARSLDLEIADDATPETILDLIGDEFLAVRTKAAENERDAEVGRRYREELIEDALKEGVRARGEDFTQDIYRGILQNSSVEGIKQLRDDWQKDGDARLAGGRKTENGDDPIKLDDHREPARKTPPDTAFVRG